MSEIAYAEIEYTGSLDWEGAVYMWGEPVVNIQIIDFKNIGFCALYAAPSSSNPNTNLTEANKPPHN